ncbi:MAG: secondary thiamine-phosphate synthase enzyme YjbQ [Deltaproteobacteria bacterium]|nr:secondary thiamine-phosphate synthase enzyme YjbQ [Deltaproteobacteria bacterium]
MHREIVVLSSSGREELIDVTDRLRAIAQAHPEAALMALFARGATSAVMIQENWDASVRTDIIECLRQIAPRGRWLHDKEDGNADAHLKSGIVGPSATIPLDGGRMLLGRWQNVFFCDFDGPRTDRELIVTLL